MTEKPNVFKEVFGDALHPAPKPEPEPDPTLVSEEAHAKLKRNLTKALDRHDALMDLPIDGPAATAGDKRIVLEAANATVKAALTTDRAALKAKSDNILYRVLLRAIFIRLESGRSNTPDRLNMLRTASRTDLEAALGKKIADYDRMEAAAAPGEQLGPLPPPPPDPPDPELQRRLDEAFGRRR
jgi:hypothetical protein